MTDAQPRAQRSATLVFTQSVLALQALTALFAALATFGLARADTLSDHSYGSVMAVLLGGFALMLLLMLAAGAQQRPWGRALGWVLQIPMIVAGLVVPAIAVMGVIFLALWITALRLGARIDRERAEREKVAQTAPTDGTASTAEGDNG